MPENYFIKELIRPFYEIMGEKALEIIYKNLEESKKKFKAIEGYEKSGFNSRIIFSKGAKEHDKNEVFSYLASRCRQDFGKHVGSIAEPMMKFILSNYKNIKI